MEIDTLKYFLKKKYLVKTLYVVLQIETILHKVLQLVPDRNKLYRECSNQIVDVVDNVVCRFKQSSISFNDFKTTILLLEKPA